MTPGVGPAGNGRAGGEARDTGSARRSADPPGSCSRLRGPSISEGKKGTQRRRDPLCPPVSWPLPGERPPSPRAHLSPDQLNTDAGVCSDQQKPKRNQKRGPAARGPHRPPARTRPAPPRTRPPRPCAFTPLSPHRQEDARLLRAVNVNDRLPRALQHYRNARLSVCLKQATFFTFPPERFKSLNRKL